MAMSASLAGRDGAFARIKPPDFRRVERALADVVADRHAPVVHFGSASAGIFWFRRREIRNHHPNVVGVFSSGYAARDRWRSGRWCRRQARPNSGSWLRASRTGGLREMKPARLVIVVGRKQQIMRTGLAGDVDTAALPSRSGRNSSADEMCRIWMRAPVHSARMAARLTASTATTRGETDMASGSRRPAAVNAPAALHDRIGLGVKRNALARRRHHLESFQHRAGRGGRNLAEGIAHIELEADDAAFDQGPATCAMVSCRSRP